MIRLRQVLNIMQSPTGEAPTPVWMTGSKRVHRERLVKMDTVFWKGAVKKRGECVKEDRFVIEPDMKWRLR